MTSLLLGIVVSVSSVTPTLPAVTSVAEAEEDISQARIWIFSDRIQDSIFDDS
jgi:hypothetical protein